MAHETPPPDAARHPNQTHEGPDDHTASEHEKQELAGASRHLDDLEPLRFVPTQPILHP